ncbi:MAG: hypothetical protein ACI9XP_000612 [Lentimonas sp.]|jgi:hypothetical protein
MLLFVKLTDFRWIYGYCIIIFNTLTVNPPFFVILVLTNDMKNMYKIYYLSIVLGLFFGTQSCSEEETDKNEIDQELLDPNSALNTNFDGKIFSIPSPVQTSMLIRDLKLPFNEDLLNPIKNLEGYSTEFKQSINLGVYGTDLGYSVLLKQNNASINYLAVVKKTTEKLKLDNAFDKAFLKRFDANINNEDSMTVIVSEAFKKSDMFLKNSNRKSTAALIIAGGWIESMYIASELNQIKNSPKIVERIGEQQLTLKTLIEVLSEYNDNGGNDSLIQDLKELQIYFDKILFEYNYAPPVTNAKTRTTKLQHDVKITIGENVISDISLKLKSIRQKITS